MASGLHEVRLGDLGNIVTGRTPPTDHAEYFGSEYPFITPTDMHDQKHATFTDRYLSEAGAKLLRRNLLPPGSIAVSCIGWQMGKVILVTRPSFTNQQINTIIAHNGINPDYLYYALLPWQKWLLSIGSGTGVRTPILNKSAFSDLRISLPSKPIQDKIAGILSAYDDLIENNTRRIKILEEMAQNLYREWFVHFRFPGHEHVRLVDSALGAVPEGWEVKRLGEVAAVNANTIKKGNEPDAIRYIDIASVSTGRVDVIQQMAFADAPGRARRIVNHGDVIWSTVRPNRKSYCLILDPPSNTIASTGFAVLTAKSVPYSYLYLATTTDDFAGYLTNHARGSAYPAVTGSDFENALAIRPSSEILNAFHSIVKPVLLQMNVLETSNGNLRRTRDLLLPTLITGVTRFS